MKPLACLHGFTGDADSWDAVLAGLPATLEVIRPSILGHDRSRPAPSQTFIQEVDRLAAELYQRAGSGYHLAGYSMGARLALGLLIRHPSLFVAATLIGVHPGLASENERDKRRAADDKLARLLEEQGLERFVDFWQQVPLFSSQQFLPRQVLAVQREHRLAHSAEGLASALRTLSLGAMPDFSRDLAKVEQPVHLMVGGLDEKFQRLATSMVDTLPQATLELVPGVGHNLLLESPEVVASALHQALV